MEGMTTNLRPSRPEITDVVNAVFDGADGVVLMQETSQGQFAELCVKTVGNIICDAEAGIDHESQYDYIRNFTPKPMPTLEVRAKPYAGMICYSVGVGLVVASCLKLRLQCMQPMLLIAQCCVPHVIRSWIV